MFNTKEWDEEIRVFLYQETGSEEEIYRNYIDWGEFREANETELLAAAGIEIPWGQILSKDEYEELLSNLSNYGIESIDVLNENSDGKVKFFEKNSEDGRYIITTCLDNYGVPSGIEHDETLPEEYKYWGSLSNSIDFEN